MLSLRCKIGQLLIMGFDEVEIDNQSAVASWLAHNNLGGVILFDKNLKTGAQGKNLINKTQIKQLLKQLNYYSNQAASHMLPLLTAIDYEGGAVDRLAFVEGCPATLSAAELASLSTDVLLARIESMAITLQELGFNLNFAPVVDLNLNERQGIIGALRRSFSSNPDEVVRVARLFVDIHNQHGLACSYKHFPGHGSAIGDTHEGFVDVTETFHPDELTPYSKLLEDKSKAVMVMTAHVINRQLDTSGLPATLSYPILTGLLRSQLNFQGVIVSDDLQMQAIAHHYSVAKALELTFNAGADMVIWGNQLGEITAPEVIDCIEQLVMDKKIPKERIDEAYQRVVRLKKLMTQNILSHV